MSSPAEVPVDKLSQVGESEEPHNILRFGPQHAPRGIHERVPELLGGRNADAPLLAKLGREHPQERQIHPQYVPHFFQLLPNHEMSFSGTIQQVVRYTYAVMRNKALNKVSAAQAGKCEAEKKCITWSVDVACCFSGSTC